MSLKFWILFFNETSEFHAFSVVRGGFRMQTGSPSAEPAVKAD